MKSKGAVSVFLCAVLVSILVAVGAACDACSLATANAYAKRMNYMACKSVLAEYDRNLFEDYSLMGFNGGEQEISDRIRKYVKKMSRTGNKSGEEIVFFDVILNDIKVECGGTSLAESEIFMEQVREHIKDKSIEIGMEKILSYINGKNDISEKKDEAMSDFTKEKEENKNKSRDDGTEQNETVERKPVSLNQNAFDAEDGTKDRVLRSRRIIESLPSGHESDINEKKRYGLGKEEDLKELGEESSKYLDTFYSGISTGTDKLVLIEYIKLYFKNAVTENNSDSETFFSNECEYILKGRYSDENNKSSVKRDLFLLRTALNIAHIYADTEKNRLTLEAAAVIAPGPYAAAVQFLIASAWAGAEAREDIDLIYSGGKVPFKKDRKSWKLDLESVLSGGKKISVEYEGGKGLDYTDYLQLLMLTCSMEKLEKRTMDLIQINMKGRYNVQFDLRNCITGFSTDSYYERISYLPGVLPGIIEDSLMKVKGEYTY